MNNNSIARLYGIHTVTALLRTQPQLVRELFVQAGHGTQPSPRLATLIQYAEKLGISIQRVSRAKLDELTQANTHQGVMAICSEFIAFDEEGLKSLLSVEQSSPIFLLILDQVQDPRNLGACMRTANAFGVQAVIVPKDRSSDLTPAARKVACGAEMATPLVRVTNLARTMNWLQNQGIWIVGTAADAALSIQEVDLRSHIAVVLGSEGEGMRHLTQSRCDFLARIPITGSVESLNVSVACGVCLYEVTRQRTQT